MTPQFALKDWSAFAPGLREKQDWVAWAALPSLPSGEAMPALSEMPPMQRRRVDKLGRMALQVAWWCQQGEAEDIPLVFASRHGDLERTYEMLRALAHDQPLSPTQFGLSTHNAIAAQYGIARKLRGNYLSVSAGAASAEAAFIEAAGLLADGVEEVLVVVYDFPMPEAYAVFGDEAQAPFAWAVRLGAADSGDIRFRLSVDGESAGQRALAEGLLPHALEVLHFLIGDRLTLEFSEGARTWRWQKDG